MSTTTELYSEILTKTGGDASTLPDNLKTTYLKSINVNIGVDVNALPDNLETTLLKAIAENIGSAGGGSEELPTAEGSVF